MDSFEDLLHAAEIAHGHLCAGQILGVRMAMLGLKRLGINDPRGADRKRLVTYVEIDRCATDAIAVVTGCRLGKRALKFLDWGKMAATFVDLVENKAIRIAALESSKDRARELYPEIQPKNAQQMHAYRVMDDAELFSEQWVTVAIHPREMPGYKSPRILCSVCGEGINYDREVTIHGKIFCQSCSAPPLRYYRTVP
jgi:formylmethanofuran dehydrogenase subunit E